MWSCEERGSVPEPPEKGLRALFYTPGAAAQPQHPPKLGRALGGLHLSVSLAAPDEQQGWAEGVTGEGSSLWLCSLHPLESLVPVRAGGAPEEKPASGRW